MTKVDAKILRLLINLLFRHNRMIFVFAEAFHWVLSLEASIDSATVSVLYAI